jgi:hypothetical protein
VCRAVFVQDDIKPAFGSGARITMKFIKQIVLLSLLGLVLAGCGNSGETGPFGNTPGPKKPTQM